MNGFALPFGHLVAKQGARGSCDDTMLYKQGTGILRVVVSDKHRYARTDAGQAFAAGAYMARAQNYTPRMGVGLDYASDSVYQSEIAWQ